MHSRNFEKNASTNRAIKNTKHNQRQIVFFRRHHIINQINHESSTRFRCSNMNVKKFNQNAIDDEHKNFRDKFRQLEIRQKIQNIDIIHNKKNQFQIDERFFETFFNSNDNDQNTHELSREKMFMFDDVIEQIRRDFKYVMSRKSRNKHRRKKSIFVIQIEKVSTSMFVEQKITSIE